MALSNRPVLAVSAAIALMLLLPLQAEAQKRSTQEPMRPPGGVTPLPRWRVAPLTKRDPKAAQAMDRIRAEFDAATNKLVELAILLKYIKKEYTNPIQTTEALYAVYNFGTKHWTKVGDDEHSTKGISREDLLAAFQAHVKLANPSVIEHAKAAVLAQVREKSLPVRPKTVQDVYKLFSNVPDSGGLLDLHQRSLPDNDKQSRLALYQEVKDLYERFPKDLVYLHCKGREDSRMMLQGQLMMIAYSLGRSCRVDWGFSAAAKHYDAVMAFKGGGDRMRAVQEHIRKLRKRLEF